MIVVPRKYAKDLGEAIVALSRARKDGLEKQQMKDVLDQIYNEK